MRPAKARPSSIRPARPRQLAAIAMMMACEFGRAAVECELRTRDDHFRVTLHGRKRHQTCNCLAPLVVERNSKKLCHPRDLVRQVGGQVIIVNEEKIGPVTGPPTSSGHGQSPTTTDILVDVRRGRLSRYRRDRWRSQPCGACLHATRTGASRPKFGEPSGRTGLPLPED